MQEVKLKRFKERLLAEQKNQLKCIREINEGGLGESMDNSFGELSTIDNHPGDVGTEMFERSKDLALKEQARFILQAIEHALEAMQDGSYGKCQVCGKEIPAERLQAVPYTTICVECKKTDEDQREIQDRPVEEDLLNSPLGRVYNDGTDKNYYDREDTWQDVARHSLSYETDPEYDVDQSGPGDEQQEVLGSVQLVEDIPYEKDEEGVIYESFKPVAELGSQPKK